jgi:hypothetical protein
MESQVSRAHGCTGATQLKTSYSDGTTHTVFELLDFMSHILVSSLRAPLVVQIGFSYQFVIAKLAALAPCQGGITTAA